MRSNISSTLRIGTSAGAVHEQIYCCCHGVLDGEFAQAETEYRQVARKAMAQLNAALEDRRGGSKHLILEGPVVEVLIRARPCTTEQLMSMDIPRFSKNNRTTYGAQILATLQQARTPPCCLIWPVVSCSMETRRNCHDTVDRLLAPGDLGCCFRGNRVRGAEIVTVRGPAYGVKMNKGELMGRGAGRRVCEGAAQGRSLGGGVPVGHRQLLEAQKTLQLG